jgi:integrase
MRRKRITFPYPFSKNGRNGKIYETKTGIFKTHFIFAHKNYQNTFATFEKALEHLDEEFNKLDADSVNSQSQYPLSRSRKDYWELEQRLKLESDGASLWQAVDFFLTFHKKKSLKPKTVHEVIDEFLASSNSSGTTKLQIRTLKRHLGHFEKSFGSRKIHTLEMQEISKWLDAAKDKRTGELWSAKTKLNTRGSLASLGTFAKRIQAIPSMGEPTEFDKVPTPRVHFVTEVEIYTPDDLHNLLTEAADSDPELLPLIVLGGMLGLRPYEAHGEDVDRPKLSWEAFDWEENTLNLIHQKVRTKRFRSIPLQKSAIQWLRPYKTLKGVIWKWRTAYDGRYAALREKSGVRSIDDGLRHSYASYRIKQLEGNIEALAEEMGNSPDQITRHYKKGVSMAESSKWFGIMPPRGYGGKITAALKLRQKG